MIRSRYRRLAALALLAGLALRAITPLGYMPAAGDGLFFELCPDQMPVTFSAAKAFPAHAHHHGATEDASEAADLCPVGHLLFSAVASDGDSIDNSIELPDAPLAIFEGGLHHVAAIAHFRPRAPPA